MASCADCSRAYGNHNGFPDLIIPNSAWRQISPSKNLGGLLCPSCMIRRLWAAGLHDVPAAFMSGPVRSVSPEAMELIRGYENRAEKAERGSDG